MKAERITSGWFIRQMLIAVFILPAFGQGQNRPLVWSDEFDGTAIDTIRWSFETGPTAGTLHYFTDRPENTRVEAGLLKLLALREPYNGFQYTASLLTTTRKFCGRYGRIEARMKLPATTGFVPGFWMLPEHDRYGYWPTSGEIDIMEHPTNQDRIYGTCHTWQYSYFTGSMTPRGGSLRVPDSETAFHVYAAEWSPEGIDFYVDDTLYFTFPNEHSGFRVWPFDQPFYILIAMGVGGGWVGDPDATTVFPGVLEVDYVRVYQRPEDIVLVGADFAVVNSASAAYSAPDIAGASYQWNVPNGATVASGGGSSRILVDWGIFGGPVSVDIRADDWSAVIDYPVSVSANLVKNAGFEGTVKYWRKNSPHPGEADFHLSEVDPHSGTTCMAVTLVSPGVNPWDVQLSQGNLPLLSGQRYHASFWARKDGGTADISAAVIHPTNYTVYGNRTCQVTGSWTKFEFDFNAPSGSIAASLNLDMGGRSGTFYFDDVSLAGPETESLNQVLNADFSAGMDGWTLNTFSLAQAEAQAANGELSVAISNGGVNTWDINVGQAGVTLENGKAYTLSFDATAESQRTIFAFVGRNSSPWNVYSGNATVSLSGRRAAYTVQFTMTEPTDTAARLGFDIGSLPVGVVLDNVFLSRGEIPSGESGRAATAPQSSRLFQNSPNPFNPATVIRFDLSGPGFVTLNVFDGTGRLVETLVESRFAAGSHAFTWNGAGRASGIYYYRLSTPGFRRTGKMVLLK